ncbi:MAG: hypothetical protein RLY35_1165, partial [Bacteroidota bacterium]
MRNWFLLLVVFQTNMILGQNWDNSRPNNPFDG